MIRQILAIAAVAAVLSGGAAHAQDVRIGDLGRFLGWRENALVGYGIVTGLSGSGDSARSEITRQTMTNVLARLGLSVTPEQVQSRNVAAVMVTATLPPSAHVGDRIDVNVSSIGDARSLAGGTLLMTELKGPDQHSYALAQGSLVVSGYRFDSRQNLQQKNYPTSGVLPGGATVEAPVQAALLDANHRLNFILKDPDAVTAQRIADAINIGLFRQAAWVTGQGSVTILVSENEDLYRLVSQIETLTVRPAALARVVINQRSGTVVAGAGVRVSPVVVSQGDIRVTVSTDQQASQPLFVSGDARGVQSLVITNTKLEVDAPDQAVVSFPNTTVGDLVQGLAKVHVSAAGIVEVLQAVHRAGALHAKIIVQ